MMGLGVIGMGTAQILKASSRIANRTLDDVDFWRQFKANPGKREELLGRLIQKYLPRIRHHASRLWAHVSLPVDIDDLISAGVFGLMDAIDRFDPASGAEFRDYCVLYIQNSMLNEIRTLAWIPRLIRAKASALNQARESFEAKHCSTPTDEELAQAMRLSMPEYVTLHQDAHHAACELVCSDLPSRHCPAQPDGALTARRGDVISTRHFLENKSSQACSDPGSAMRHSNLASGLVRS